MSGLTAPGFNWAPHLTAGERILWYGRPREGAGWRCVLRADRAGLAGMACIVAGMAAVVVHGAEGTLRVWAVVAPLVAAVFVVATLAYAGAKLAGLRYAITDQRSLVVDASARVTLAIPHAASAPTRRYTPCGVWIGLGKAPPRGVLVGRDADDVPVRFKALDPDDDPWDLLCSLAPERRRANDLPWRPGFTR